MIENIYHSYNKLYLEKIIQYHNIELNSASMPRLIVNKFCVYSPITAAISCAPVGRSARRYILIQEKYLRIMTTSPNRKWLYA